MPNPRISEWSNAGLISDCCSHFLYFAIDKGTTYQIFTFFIKNYETYKKVYSYNNYLQTIHNYFFNPRNVNGSQRVYLNEILNNESYLSDSVLLI